MGAALVQMEKISKSYGPGSHKMDIAPAGFTLLFAEPLIHATGQIHSERERVILSVAMARVTFRTGEMVSGQMNSSNLFPTIRRFFFTDARIGIVSLKSGPAC